MKHNYSTEIRKAPDGKEYLKVFLLDNNNIGVCKSLLEKCKEIRKVNITTTESKGANGDTITVYPKPEVDATTVETVVKALLDNYFSGTFIEEVDTNTEVHFQAIESNVLNALDDAKATIDVCMAWFTNDKLRDKLLEKQAEGCVVRVIRFKDGTNKAFGVDLQGIDHIELRGHRHGIMHRKFCVIDNQTVIDGSYNWTNNAETKNDENIDVHKNDLDLASKYTKEFNRVWNSKKRNG